MAWEKQLKHIDLPAAVLKESSTQTWKKTGAVQELLKVSSLMITTPEEPTPLVEEVEPAVAPLPPLKQFRIRRGPLLEYDPNQPRLPKGTPTVGDVHAGEWRKGGNWASKSEQGEIDFKKGLTQFSVQKKNKDDEESLSTNGLFHSPAFALAEKLATQKNKKLFNSGMGSESEHGDFGCDVVFSDKAPQGLKDFFGDELKNPFTLQDWWDDHGVGILTSKNTSSTKWLVPLEWLKKVGGKSSGKASPEEETLNNAAELAKKFPSLKTNWVVGDFVKYVPPVNAPDIPINKNMTYTLTKVDYDKQVVQLDGSWMIPMSFILDSMGKENGYNPAENPLPPIKKFKVTHAERPDIPQVFNVGDKVSFRGKMYFVKYVNPKDHMIQIELAKIRHKKVVGVVTGAIVNVKPDTIYPWGMKPNNKAMQVGGDAWNKKTALRLEYDYARVKPLLEKIAAVAVGGKTEVMVKKTSWDDLDSQMQSDIEEKWKSENYDKELEYQKNEWYENNSAEDAKK